MHSFRQKHGIAWHSGGTPDFCRQTFPVLCLTCSLCG